MFTLPRTCLRLTALALLSAASIVALSAPAAFAQTATTSILYSFQTDLQIPISPLMQASDGNFYGVAVSGAVAAEQIGGIYRITPGATSPYSLVHAFNSDTSEGVPAQAALVEGTDGNLYGVTQAGGGPNNNGTFYRVNPVTNAFTVLHSFGSEAASTFDALTLGSDGNFYVSTAYGGSHANGSILQITPSGTTTLLYSFSGPEGENPLASLLETAPGTFYGTAQYGGANSEGAIFKVVVTTTGGLSAAVTDVYDFKDADDAESAQFTEGPTGLLYTTSDPTGDTTYGSVLAFNPATAALTTPFTFTANNSVTYGFYPSAPLFLGSDNNFYDATSESSFAENGDVLRITPAGVVTTLFDGSNEQNNELQAASTGVIQGSDGNLYLQTPQGGAGNHGDIVETKFTTPLAPPVKLTLSSSSVAANTAVTLNWSVANAYSTTLKQCYAYIQGNPTGAGSWSGKQTGTGGSGGVAYTGSASITPTVAGTYTYALTCGGTESGFATLTVTGGTTKNPTTTTASESPSPSIFGSTRTFTIHVTSASGSPSGNATLTIGSQTYWTVGVSNGSATYVDSSALAPGTYNFTITYNGSSTYATSAGTGTFVITKATASLAPNPTPNPVYAGQPLTLSATVTAPNSHPTGTVTFFFGTSSLGTVSLNGSGVATLPSFSTTGIPAGNYGLSASYSGDTDFASSAPTGFNVTVKAVVTTTLALTANANPDLYGSPLVLSATLKDSSGNPVAGAPVTFYFAGNYKLGSATTNASGVTTSTQPSTLPANTYALSASYAGDAGHVSSTGTLNLTIQAATTTTLAANPSTFPQGKPTTFLVQVKNPSGTYATGMPVLYVAFTATGGGTAIGAFLPLFDGSSALSVSTSDYPPGVFYLYAVYPGDGISLPSTSPRIQVTVTQAQ
jgi:uncharacterized repeat protein (TIGR03803 family)